MRPDFLSNDSNKLIRTHFAALLTLYGVYTNLTDACMVIHKLAIGNAPSCRASQGLEIVLVGLLGELDPPVYIFDRDAIKYLVCMHTPCIAL